MAKITYTNERGDSIVLGQSAPFFVTNIEGFSNVNNKIGTTKSPYQDGETETNFTLDSRYLVIQGEYYTEDRQEGRNKLIKVFNPKLKGKLRYENGSIIKEISCRPEKSPTISSTNRATVPYIINLFASNPFWEDLEEGKEEIALWISDWEFPVNIPVEGMEFGHRATTLIKNIINNGDVPCGMRIEFKALATVVNPSIFDFNTREFIKVKRNLLAGEKLIINTSFGNKRVELLKSNGTIENIFHYIDLKSTFIQLDVGDNLIQYDAEEGIDNLEVSIYHKPLYIGV